MLVDRLLVRAAGTVLLIGGGIFVWLAIPLVAGYLFLAGLIFWGFTIRWRARYERVLDQAPEGYERTGEIYGNPGANESVEVWHRGIRRVYVRIPN